MPSSQALASYDDVRAFMDRALDSERGVRIPVKDRNRAIHLRQRSYALRKLDRDISREVYPDEDKRHGRSVYDCLVITIDPDGNMLIHKTSEADFEIEML